MSEMVKRYDMPGGVQMVMASAYDRKAQEVDHLEKENQALKNGLRSAEICCQAIDNEQRLLIPAIKQTLAERDALLEALEKIIKPGLSISLTETQLDTYDQLLAKIRDGQYRYIDMLIDLGLGYKKDQNHKDDIQPDKRLKTVARLITGKKISLQIINFTDEERTKLLNTVKSNKTLKSAKPYIQNDHEGWLMFEFWTKDLALIVKCAQIMAQSINIPLSEGDCFTTAELSNDRFNVK